MHRVPDTADRAVGVGEPRYVVEPAWTLPIKGGNPEVPGVAVNSKGEIHLATRSPDLVMVFAPDRRFLRAWGAGVLRFPHGITIDAEDRVYVPDTVDHVVRQFSPSGDLLMTLGIPGRPSQTGFRDDDDRTITTAAEPFNQPTNVAVAPDGTIYVSDGYGNARVHRFSAAGRLELAWGGPGTDVGEFRIPHGIAVDRRGRVYVADRENDRIQIFEADGTFLEAWTDVRRPNGVAIDGAGRVFVAEFGHRAGAVASMERPSERSPVSRVTIRDPGDGSITGSWGADHNAGSDDPCSPGNFFAAHGICVAPDGAVFVGEVVHSANGGASDPAVTRVGADCHALQVFRPI
ncbi:MAG TPA: peptidyl-alpha-hydroxyglycine alpha-amidating lyase family protein [Candidatus Dormibacteraeota bacterium]|jgi:DNA-binding beta-propeller fold protein YncE|nr:peptidyl-alpha-hydroxyglycine alpha-amidating lyase family protein [Candidatus Dormibacteraeota bacterium]